MIFRLTLLLLLFPVWMEAQQIIPQPLHYEVTAGQLPVPSKPTIGSADAEFAGLIPSYRHSAGNLFGIKIKEKKRKPFIQLVRNREIIGKEAYRMTISTGGITVEAGHVQGCFYGLQSTLQLLNQARGKGSLPCAVIQDQPRFAWRGVMLDESRFFFGKEEVKQILDLMALHKLNKFHWHLTDVPGWRIEIREFPLLTTVGGIGNHMDPEAPAKYYTQAEISEIVRYAEERFIEVIPEIDMPGHATAAVKAYPEYSGGGSERYPEFTFHPGKDATYTFLTKILREVAGLFPSKYIHIGGDEVHFGNEQWSKLPEVKQLMDKHRLETLVDVEHYFLQRMADSIKTLGRTVFGWDEVVTAGLSNDNTAVMWWRHDKPVLLKESLDKNYHVVLCPRIPLYFDFVQHESHIHGRKWTGNYAPIEKVYRFPAEDLTGGVPADNPLVMGIQANVWTETIHTPERLQFMLYPRISALAEASWTSQERKDFENFRLRLEKMLELYQKKGIRFYDFRKSGSDPEIHGPVK